jgi:MazG family protein
MPPLENYPQLARLIDIVARLRAPDGCPWDREQTEASMAPHLLEEAFEAVDALQSGDAPASREELGDVLMNVLMIAQIAGEHGRYDLEQVAEAIADKLVRRHPHVFGDVAADDAAQVLRNWEAIKQQEKSDADGEPRSVLAGVPAALPALLRAFRIGEKAARVGFDWPDREGPREKVDEELAELDAALAAGDEGRIGAELGDLLFAVVNVARHAGVNPEMALRAMLDRFVQRFRWVEQQLGARLREASLDEKEALWQEAKEKVR